jgi:signal transduction histidine kinase
VTVVQLHESGNDWVEIRVADQGPGIPDIEKEIVFQRFYSSKDEKSAGLGLSIVKSVAQAHGGMVFIVDNKPRGAVFVIRMSPQANLHPV